MMRSIFAIIALIVVLHATDLSPLWLIPGYAESFIALVMGTPFGLPLYLAIIFGTIAIGFAFAAKPPRG